MALYRSSSHRLVEGPRITWSAVFAGSAVAVSLQIVLTLAGLGFGAWAIDLHDANPTEGIPVGAALWTGVSMLMSAFVGGYMTARLSSSVERGDGLYHGVVAWGVNWLVCAWLTTTAMATMIGGAFSILATTFHAVAQGLSSGISASESRPSGAVTLSLDDIRREIESVIHASSKPNADPQTHGEHTFASQRQEESLNWMTETSLTELRDRLWAFDREAAVHLMRNRYRMTDVQARDIVQSTIGLLGRSGEAGRGAHTGSSTLDAEALNRLGMIALWLSGLGLVTLVVSSVGGILGTPEEALIDTTTRTDSYIDIRRAS